MLDLSDAFATFPVLETPRLLLREPSADDAAATFRIMSDPQVTRYFGRAPMTAPEQGLRRITSLQDAFRSQEGIRWAIVLRETGEYLGSCGFWRLVREHFRAEIGYELDPAHWGRGLMTEAVAVALDFGLGPMGLHSVEAQIAPENVGSRRVLEKLGFVQEAHFRQNYYEPDLGLFTDTIVFSMLKADWQSRRLSEAI